MSAPVLRTGIDLVEVGRIEQLNEAIRERFLRRVFTPAELELAGERWESAAGRVAAKEAVAKALGCGIGPVQWQEIEIRRGENGEPVLALHGEAQRVADALGLTTWSVSISHSKTHAVAVAVAIG